MTLIKSISGIRGTIGGKPGDNLTPVDIVECTAAYATLILESVKKPTIVVGRDGRISGASVEAFVIHTLNAMGINTIDLGYSTTPTVEYMVMNAKADGGIVLTASHNPRQWNALKFLNHKGEFISAEEGERLLQFIDDGNLTFADIDSTGTNVKRDDAIDIHIDAILELDCIDVEAIRTRKFHIVADCINSTGALAIPALLKRIHCTYSLINEEMSGDFAHNPEPLETHLRDLMAAVKRENGDLGIAVDPDVDRLALVTEKGTYFGEEYTLVACADSLLSQQVGNTVSNMSSTRALRDITEKYGGSYAASKVGEVNVVTKMKETNAIIGGEGNGGVILPALHYGRDALVGIAMILHILAKENLTATQLRAKYPDYTIAKHKVELTADMDVDNLLEQMAAKYADLEVDKQDGVKIYFEDSWVHLRKSNTEPIIRIYAESTDETKAENLTKRFDEELNSLL